MDSDCVIRYPEKYETWEQGDAGAGETRSEFDVVIVGGGTAGAILAARLSEEPKRSVCLIEWGPSDLDEMRALAIRRWPEMFESECDLDYRHGTRSR